MMLRILLSEELEMEAGYGEGEIVQSFRLLNWSLFLLFLEKLWAIYRRRKVETHDDLTPLH